MPRDVRIIFTIGAMFLFGTLASVLAIVFLFITVGTDVDLEGGPYDSFLGLCLLAGVAGGLLFGVLYRRGWEPPRQK